MYKIVSVLCACVCTSVFGSIDVHCAEFAPAQQDELRAVVAAVENRVSGLLGVDVGAIDDGAFVEVHLLHRDYAMAYEDVLGEDSVRDGWAFVSAPAKQAHVALQPPVPDAMLAAGGVPLQTKVQMARTVVHLCISRAINFSPLHPEWFTEGLADSLAADALRDAGIMGGVVEEPWTSTEILRIRTLLDEHPSFGVEQVMAGETIKDEGRAMYALRGAIISWINDQGALSEIVKNSTRALGTGNYAKNLSAMVSGTLMSAGVSDFNAEFREWLDGFTPRWDQEYRSLETTGEIWAHSAFSSRNAVCWNTQPLGDEDWAMSGSLKIFKADKTQMNILIGRSDEGYLSIAIGPTFGVTVFHRQYSDGGKKSNWVRLINEEVKSLELDEWMDFKVSKRRDRLMIRLGKQRPVRIDLDGLDISGPWGLGAQQDSSGLWRDVKVEW